MSGRTVDYGDRALLVECDSTDEVLALADALRRTGAPGLLDVVPGARTVMVAFADEGSRRRARAAVDAVTAAPAAARDDGAETVIDVVYDGADLAEVATLLRMGPAAVVAAHTGTPWQVAFCGFAPGFGYLTGGDPRLAVPRRSDPRTRVPAGSVALAGEFSGVYPRESPGGWQLIGRTDAVLWDPAADPPALLRPGMRVRFRAIGSP